MVGSSVKSNQLFRRTNGEHISFAEYGDPQGHPVLFCHGAPGSRFQITPTMAKVAESKKARLIIPDRPGFGESNFSPGRTILDWPEFIDSLLVSLDVEELSAIGYSMGGIYALACAYAYPKRFLRVALAGSMSPNILHQAVQEKMPDSSRRLFMMARDEPAELRRSLASLAETPEHFLDLLAAPMPACDRKIFFKPEVHSMFMHDCKESLRMNAEGLVTDFALSVRYWGFDLETIKTPVVLWHGIEDFNVPLAAAQYLASVLNIKEQYLLPDEGHLCLFNHWEEILNALAP